MWELTQCDLINSMDPKTTWITDKNIIWQKKKSKWYFKKILRKQHIRSTRVIRP
jgi:hypothetical protein